MGLLLGAACGVFLWEPWHGPVVLSLSKGHGIDAGDLPALPLIAFALALAHPYAREALAKAGWSMGRLARAAVAVALGALLLLVAVDPTSQLALVPAGGGTFDGSTQHADGSRADPVGRWSHVAVTYDARRLRLYFDGDQVASRDSTGPILTTTDPLWIGGNRPYGEYFQGVIDEVRVYDRALSRSEVRAEMKTPIASERTTPPPGLVGAFAFDAGSGSVAADTSGNGNAGTIHGARWTANGRFGSAMRFEGAGNTVRVPASPSLDLSDAMTLSAWIRPTTSQSGWRTIMNRQTDAYFLTAGGGSQPDGRMGALDNVRLALVILAALAFCLTLARGRPPAVMGRRAWYWAPVVLFLAGSIVDAALTPADTLIGPTFLAIWVGVTAARRYEAVLMYLIAAAFAVVTIVSLGEPGVVELAHDDGGTARSMALGVLLVTAGLTSALRAGLTRE